MNEALTSLPDTKERLLDAAEQLFAEQGIAETSLRDITALAEANLASVNYHFGSKDALLEAVFARRIRPVNRQRLALLDSVEGGDRSSPPAVEAILWAFLSPPFDVMQALGEAGQRFMQLVGRINSDPNHGIHEAFLRQFESVRVRFHAALVAALPGLDDEEVTRRMHYVVGGMAHTFCWCRAVPCLCPPVEGDPLRVVRSLVAFAAAGMRAQQPSDAFAPLGSILGDPAATAANEAAPETER